MHLRLFKVFGVLNAFIQSLYRDLNEAFILSGGGARLVFYNKAFGPVFEGQLIPITPWKPDPTDRRAANQGLRRIHFDVPRDFRHNSVSPEDFDRLSVAHGLAYGGENLMKITGAHPPEAT